MEAQNDPEFKGILNRSLLTVPDGMPTVWVGRLKGFRSMKRVFGPDLMVEICARSVQKGYTHFLYGGAYGVAERLKQVLLSRFPGIHVVGTHTPPFRPLTETEFGQLKDMISELNPDFFWVGLSTPKQERFMAAHIHQLAAKVMIGVGAAFDIHTGRLRDAPDWVKNLGLQWIHRLIQEPTRLWKRYLKNNPKFVWMTALQLMGTKHYSQPSEANVLSAEPPGRVCSRLFRSPRRNYGPAGSTGSEICDSASGERQPTAGHRGTADAPGGAAQ